MKTIYKTLAPLVPFLADEAVTSICITPPSKPGPDDDDSGSWGRGGEPKAPSPKPSPALA